MLSTWALPLLTGSAESLLIICEMQLIVAVVDAVAVAVAAAILCTLVTVTLRAECKSPESQHRLHTIYLVLIGGSAASKLKYPLNAGFVSPWKISLHGYKRA